MHARCVYYATASAADLTKPDLGGDRNPHAARLPARPGRDLGRGASDGSPASRAWTSPPSTRRSRSTPRRHRYSATGWSTRCPSAWACSTATANWSPCPRSGSSSGSSARRSPALGQCARPRGWGWSHRTRGSTRHWNGLTRCRRRWLRANRAHARRVRLCRRRRPRSCRHRGAGRVPGRGRPSSTAPPPRWPATGIESLIAWALERAPDDPPPRPHYPEKGLPADEPTARLRHEMAAAVGAAAAWRAVNVT